MVPLRPSISMRLPFGMRRRASRTETTQGTPSSRLTMAAWLAGAPMSHTTPPAIMNSGTQDGSVVEQTMISPGCSSLTSETSKATRARPCAIPGETPRPVSVSPGAARVPAGPTFAGGA